MKSQLPIRKDKMTPAQWSYCMSRIKGKDTEIEIIVRSALHANGLRYRKHVSDLPGKPDIVFVQSKVVVFVDGNFWHGHSFDNWKHKLKPFWRNKIKENIKRDQRNFRKLRRNGWKVIRIWEKLARRNLHTQIQRVEEAVRGRVWD